MTSSMPPGDAVTTDDSADAALDEDAPPATGLEPDTAADAPGEGGASADVAPTPDQDGQPQAVPTTLVGPALENVEMRRGTEDLQSSEEKLAQAKEYADAVAAKTLPTS